MTGLPSPLVVTPVVGMPEVTSAHGLDGLAALVSDALRDNGIDLADGDVLVLSSKVVSKALGLRSPADGKPEVVLGQSRRVVAERRTPDSTTRIVEAVAGPVMAAAGVDASNTGSTDLLLLPDDPDACARRLLDVLVPGSAADPGDHADRSEGAAPPRVGLVLSDTAGRPWRWGQIDFALGAAGLTVLDDLRGAADADGRALSVTVRCLADEIAAAADLVKGKDRHIALAHLRGLPPADPAATPTPRGKSSWDLRQPDAPNPTITPHEGGAGGGMTGARGLVRTGPGDWFSHGTYEAVRAALGVSPATPEAERIGVPSITAEDLSTRLARAVDLAVHGLDPVTTTIEGDRLELASDDPFALGQALGRLHAALWAEDLAGTVEHRPGSPTRVALGVHERP